MPQPKFCVHVSFMSPLLLRQLLLDKSTVLLIPALTRIPRRVVVVALVAAALTGGLIVTSPIGSARADDTDGISGAPSTETSADGRSRFSYQASPGQQLTDNYVVRNTGTTAKTMKVFATDAYNTEDGAYGLLDTGVVPADAGNWVTFEGGAKQLDIPLDPGATRVIPFTLDVPADAAPGDHAAGIVVSVTGAEGQILVDRRVATRVYVRVPGDLQPALSISSIAADYQGQFNPLDGQTTITFTVKNSGNVALGATMLAGVNTYFGIGAAEQTRQELAEMLPGSTRTITMTVPGTGQWGYLNPYVSLQPTIDDDALDPGVLPQVHRDTVTFAVPWLLLIAIAIAAAIYLFIRIRRARDEKTARDWIAYTEAEARRKARDETAEPIPTSEPR
jgi:dihydroorotate dehydrogenase (fumarate)